MDPQKIFGGLMVLFLVLLFAVSLVGPFQAEVTSAQENVTGGVSTFVGFLPWIFVVIIILIAIGGMKLGGKI